MEEDSTPVASTDDDLDLSGEDSRDDADDTTADSGDDSGTDDSNDDDGSDDNAPSGADDKSGDDEKSTDKSTDKKPPAFDKDLDKWAEERGYGSLETDKERRLAQDARNSQRDFSKRSEANKAAQKLADNVADSAKPDATDDDADPLAKDVARLSNELNEERQNRRLTEFFVARSDSGNPVTQEEADVMGDYLKKVAETDGKAGVNFLIKDISRWHSLTQAEMGDDKSVNADEIAEKARKEERERIAKNSNAAGPTRSAKVTTPKKEVDALEKLWKDDD